MRYIAPLLLCLTLLLPISQPASAKEPPASGSPAGPIIAPEAHLLPAWTSPSPSPLPPAPPGVLEPALARALAEVAADELLHIVVILREQALPAHADPAIADRATSRSRLVTNLQSLASDTQAPLRAYLTGAQISGSVESFTPFWIFNGIAVRARPSAVYALAAQPDVATIRMDHYRHWVDVQAPSDSPQQATHATTAWGVARLRADQVWASLHVSGTGAVVAGMDTGVDWLHPSLQANYRGYNPHGIHSHVGNWFDAVKGSSYPLDDHGHGTHTLGTAVGQDGIGVAPGAEWIGIKALDSGGSGFDSWMHAGFQWLLAPGGYPEKAPDAVNCSWGNENAFLTTFQADIQALRAAGILPVFSNGNMGPSEVSVGSPASLPGAFAVGATDDQDEVANFSSRGPSPWGEIRPHVVAPGVDIRSSLPGGNYGLAYGTSMAAPHVSGLAALMRSVSPTLSLTNTMFLITSTAVPLGDPTPNNSSGWGRVDAFAAVAALAHPGFITGTVSSSADGTPIAGASVTAVPHGGGGWGTAATGGDGAYLLALAPAIYDLTASAFGYAEEGVLGVGITTDTTTSQDFVLTPLPTGILRGQITAAETSQPLMATITVLDTPLEAVTHTYTFDLPMGTYTIRGRSLGHQVLTTTATVTAGQVTTVNLALPSAPSILLVDSGLWYYGSEAGYFRQALDDLAYAFDEWPIRHLPDDLPTAADLMPYGVVVWSAPWDAPGFIGAEDAIIGYLSAGGRLLLSGQDIGYLDGGDWGDFAYYTDYLKAGFVRDSANIWTLDGVSADLFSGTTITIAGSGGADNQLYPDEISVTDPDSAAPVFVYRGNGYGGIRIGTCLDYRVIYLAFGFEAINERSSRQAVMEQALAWLVADPPTVGLELKASTQPGIGPPGTVVTHTLRLRHIGQAGAIDQFTLAVDGASWDTHVNPSDIWLSPCCSANAVVTVTVPLTAAWDAHDVVTLTASSSVAPSLAVTAVLTTKAPAPILLVDDDLFFEQREIYETTLAEAALAYDFWQTCPAVGLCTGQSPPLEIMRRYPVTVWWTGSDWHQPVTADERAILEEYLSSQGRLLLSSQDFLYYHHDSVLSRGFLGVLAHREDVTPTLASGVPGNPLSAGLGPWPLSYPAGYQNWSDEVQPTPGTSIVLRDQVRRGIGLARREAGHATAFLAFPFEALPEAARAEAMQQTVGWLSWLGASSFAADRGAIAAGAAVTYTLRVHNDGYHTVTASVSNTLPISLALVTGTLTGPATYTPTVRRIDWTGALAPAAAITIAYQATVTAGVPAGTPIANTVDLAVEDHKIQFQRAAVVRVETPDLTPSVFWAAPDPARSGTRVTAALVLVNAGPADALAATAAISPPVQTTLVTDTVASIGGAVEVLSGDDVRWTGPISAAGKVTVTYQLTLPTTLTHAPLYSVAFLDDGQGGTLERAMWLRQAPWQFYLPVVGRSGSWVLP